MSKRNVSIALLLFVTFFPSGCTYNVPPIDATLHQKPLIESIPITVGSYSSDVFRSYESVNSLPLQPDISYRFSLGAPSLLLFDQIFSAMFEKVVKVNSLPLLHQDNHDIKAVIEPRIEDVAIDADLNISWIQVDLHYNITLYDLNGADIANWTIKGSGTSVGLIKSLNHPVMVREATQNAMRNVAARFMLGFRRNPEARNWLRSIGIAAGD